MIIFYLYNNYVGLYVDYHDKKKSNIVAISLEWTTHVFGDPSVNMWNRVATWCKQKLTFSIKRGHAKDKCMHMMTPIK